MNKLIVISGCSGGGKSTLLSELSNHGYSVIPEIGRDVYKEYAHISPKDPIFMCETIIERSVAAYHQAKKVTTAKDNKIFFDRSYLECVSYYQQSKLKNSDKYDHLIHELRYYPTVLMVPPWKEIFRQDDERQHSFEESYEEYKQLLESYPKYGYTLLEIPKVSVKERFQFILSVIP